VQTSYICIIYNGRWKIQWQEVIMLCHVLLKLIYRVNKKFIHHSLVPCDYNWKTGWLFQWEWKCQWYPCLVWLLYHSLVDRANHQYRYCTASIINSVSAKINQQYRYYIDLSQIFFLCTSWNIHHIKWEVLGRTWDAYFSSNSHYIWWS